MSISSFIRDTAYFQIRRDQQMMINAEDFDLQFNNIANYTNNKIRPIVNNLQGNGLPGTDEPGTANTFLRNIGDGNTEWAPINNEAINNFAITFSKLVLAATGSIFATGNDRIFRTVTPTDVDQVLVSTNNDLPVWQKLQGENFADRVLAGNHINYAAINATHLSPQIIGRPVHANSILERHILDQTIPGSKMMDGALVGAKIDQGLLDTRMANLNGGRGTFLDNSIENRHFPDNSIDRSQMQLRLTPNDSNGRPLDDNVNYTFTPDNIIDNSITSAFFSSSFTLRIPITCLAPGSVEPRHIATGTFSYVFQAVDVNVDNGVYLNIKKIRKEKLSQSIRNKLGI